MRNAPILLISEHSTGKLYEKIFDKIIYVNIYEIIPLIQKLSTDETLYNFLLNEQLNMWKKITDDKIYTAFENMLEGTSLDEHFSL